MTVDPATLELNYRGVNEAPVPLVDTWKGSYWEGNTFVDAKGNRRTYTGQELEFLMR